jgi:transcriptional regulator with XRE-family HTH domain
MTNGQKLKLLRDNAKISQKKLSKITRLHIVEISRWENGHVELSTFKLAGIALVVERYLDRINKKKRGK